jgi:hypothetical protein
MSIRALVARKGILTTSRHGIVGAGQRATTSHEVEVEVLEWVDIEQSILEDLMLMNQVVAKLRELLPSLMSRRREIFRSRLWRVILCNNDSICKTTHQAQMTQDSVDMITNCGECVRQKMLIFNFYHSSIGNFNNSKVYFSPDCKCTL